ERQQQLTANRLLSRAAANDSSRRLSPLNSPPSSSVSSLHPPILSPLSRAVANGSNNERYQELQRNLYPSALEIQARQLNQA
ncbi:hypothetical protein Dimus_016727, partial [Dionaea muscipula]